VSYCITKTKNGSFTTGPLEKWIRVYRKNNNYCFHFIIKDYDKNGNFKISVSFPKIALSQGEM
jgi:hypothetical protein